jgi:hypothetical protein
MLLLKRIVRQIINYTIQSVSLYSTHAPGGCYDCDVNQVPASYSGIESCQCLPGSTRVPNIDKNAFNPLICDRCPGISVSPPLPYPRHLHPTESFVSRAPGIQLQSPLTPKRHVSVPRESISILYQIRKQNFR